MTQDTFHAAVDLLISLNKEHTARFSKEVIGNIGHALEFSTVRINVGRRAGYTTYINSRAKEGDLIVVPEEWHRFNYQDTNCRVVTPEFVASPEFTSDKINTVYIDCPSAVFREVYRIKLYKALLKFGAERFILLGD